MFKIRFFNISSKENIQSVSEKSQANTNDNKNILPPFINGLMHSFLKKIQNFKLY